METDRFALAVTICEMMVWNSDLEKKLGRPQLLNEDIVLSGKISDIPDHVKSSFSQGFALLEKALRAGKCDDMPTPDDWLTCLGVRSVVPSPFKTTPQVLFFRRKGNGRKLHKQAVLNTNPTGSFGVVDKELNDIAFSRNSTESRCALDRSGVAMRVAARRPAGNSRKGGQGVTADSAGRSAAVRRLGDRL